MSKDNSVKIGNNQNPIEQYLIDKLNNLKSRQKLKRPWDMEEVIWQFEEVLFQFRKHTAKSNQSKNNPYKYCHDGWPGITDQPWYKPLNTPEELKRANEAHALKHRPIRPEIHNRESRKFYNLPPCTCDSSEWGCNYYASRGL